MSVLNSKAFNPDDEDGKSGASQALKSWDGLMKSMNQAVQKAQKDLVRETNKHKANRIKHEAKEAKRAKAHAKAAAARILADDDHDGEALVGVEVWSLYASMTEAMKAGGCRLDPDIPIDASDWIPRVSVPTILTAEEADIDNLKIETNNDGLGSKPIIEELPEWPEQLPSVAEFMEKATSKPSMHGTWHVCCLFTMFAYCHDACSCMKGVASCAGFVGPANISERTHASKQTRRRVLAFRPHGYSRRLHVRGSR